MNPVGEASGTDTRPTQALSLLARALKDEGSLLSANVISGLTLQQRGFEPIFGRLVGAGPRTAVAPGEYALVFEAVREGYLLHYDRPRLLEGIDPDLALLAGDYLYALGLDRLARLGDPPAVALLGDLISLTALCRSEALDAAVDALWLATTVAVAGGETPEISVAKEHLRALEPTADRDLWQAAEIAAQDSDMGPALLLAAKAIDFPAVNN